MCVESYIPLLLSGTLWFVSGFNILLEMANMAALVTVAARFFLRIGGSLGIFRMFAIGCFDRPIALLRYHGRLIPYKFYAICHVVGTHLMTCHVLPIDNIIFLGINYRHGVECFPAIVIKRQVLSIGHNATGFGSVILRSEERR